MILVVLSGCGGLGATAEPVKAEPPPPPPPSVEYVLRGVAGRPSALDVDACLAGLSSGRLRLLVGGGIERATRGGRRLIVEGGRAIVVGGIEPEGCVRYRVALPPGVRDGLLDDGSVLARPEGAPPGTRVTVAFEESAGRIVTPYRVWEGGLAPRASFFERSTTWARSDAGVARTLHVGDVELRLVVLPGPRAISDDALVDHVASALELAVRLAPERYPKIVLAAIAPSVGSASGSPISFGLARRGGGASVLFVLDSHATEDALVGDWVAIHELSHFAFPAMPRSEAWLTEGWATYFQEVLRARAGILAPRETWLRLHRGFARGRDASTGRALHRESAEMFRTYAFLRVYWAGAANALEADVHLRARGLSLEAALGRVFEGDSFDTWVSFEDFAARLAGAGHPELAERARQARAATDFPDVSSSYEALGLEPQGAALGFDEGEAVVNARRAIVSGDL